MDAITDTLLKSGVLALALGSGGYLLWNKMEQRRRDPRGLPLPPGPKGVPFLGNIVQVTQGKSWETYNALSKEFGNLIYLEVIGQPLLILNSTQEINELLEKRASNFSDRVHTPSLNLLQMGWNCAIANYGPFLKNCRRVFHQHFGPSQLSKYHPVLEEQSIIFLRRLAADPHDFVEALKHFFGEVVI